MDVHINLKDFKRKSEDSKKSNRHKKGGHRLEETGSQLFNDDNVPITMDSLSSYAYRKGVKHVCTVTPDPDPIVMAITEGYFVQCRRRFRKLFLASKNNPSTQIYLKSTTAILKEWRRHLKRHYFIIHPFSIFSSYWSVFMILVNTGILVVSPISYLYFSAINYKEREGFAIEGDLNPWHYARLSLLGAGLFDVWLSFLTGYANYDTKEIILNPRTISRHFVVTGSIFFDFFGLIPMDTLLFHILPQNDVTKGLIKLSCYIHWLRLYNLFINIDRFGEWQGLNIFRGKVFKLAFVYTVFLLWSACESARLDLSFVDSMGLLYLRDHTMGYVVIRKLSRSISTVLLVQPQTSNSSTKRLVGYKLFDMLNMTVGYFLRFVMYGFIFQLIQRHNTAREKYVLLRQQISDYCHFKMLPDFLRKRIFHYFHFRYQKYFLKEDDIWYMLSDQLKQEVTMSCCKGLVEGVVFFKPLPLTMLVKIVKCLKRDFYLPNDIILTAGTSGDNMYFIATGTVAVYLKTGKEVCHLTEGDHFGEIALVLTTDRTSSVVALEPCEIYTLSRKDFHKVIEVHPPLLERVTTLAEERLQATAIMLHNEGIHELCNCSLGRGSVVSNVDANKTPTKESAFAEPRHISTL